MLQLKYRSFSGSYSRSPILSSILPEIGNFCAATTSSNAAFIWRADCADCADCRRGDCTNGEGDADLRGTAGERVSAGERAGAAAVAGVRAGERAGAGAVAGVRAGERAGAGAVAGVRAGERGRDALGEGSTV